jgi:hypothetical protein
VTKDEINEQAMNDDAAQNCLAVLCAVLERKLSTLSGIGERRDYLLSRVMLAKGLLDELTGQFLRLGLLPLPPTDEV